MPGPFITSDLAELYDTDDHGTTAVFTPAGGAAEDPIVVIIQREGFIRVDPESGEDQSQTPIIRCIQTDLTGTLSFNSTFTINSVVHKVLAFETDYGEYVIELSNTIS